MSCSRIHAVSPVRLEPATLQSRGKHSTTEPLLFRTVILCLESIVATFHLHLGSIGVTALSGVHRCDNAISGVY